MKPAENLPLIARAAIRLGAPSYRHEDLLGDSAELHADRLAEMGRFRASVTTTRDALVIASAFLLHRLKESTDMGNWITWLDIKLALRLARKRPLLDATALLALTVGIALAIMGFTLLDAMAFCNLPYDNGDRFLRIDVYSAEDGRYADMELDRYHMLIERADTLAYLGAKVHTRFPITHPSGEVESVVGARLEPGIFAFLPARPVLGRTLIEADGAQGAEPVALIGESLWRARYGSRPDVLGLRVEIDGSQREIVGVMPEDFGFPNSARVWLPLDTLYVGGTAAGMSRRAEIIAVMTADSDRKAVIEQMTTLSAQFETGTESAELLSLDIVPYTWGRNMNQAWLMMGVMLSVLILVLVVIAANVGNLVMVRNAARSTELAVRAALGAGRGRLVMQLIAEVAILVGVATVLGFALANGVLVRILASLEHAPFWLHFSPSPRTVAAAALLATITTLAAGIGPSFGATRHRMARELKAGGRGGGGPHMGRLTATLTIVQMALSVAFVGAALVAAQSAQSYRDPQIDLPSERFATAQLAIRQTPEEALRDDSADAVLARRTAVIEAIAAIPGVEGVGITDTLPGESADTAWVQLESSGHAASDGTGDASRAARVSTASVLPGFFEALDLDPHQGRFFDATDLGTEARPVAVINARLANEYFATRPAVGQRLRVLSDDGSSGPWIEIVGVAPDLGMSPANPALAAGFYLPMETRRWMSVAMRVDGGPDTFAGPLRKAVGKVDSDIGLIRIQPLSEVAAEEALTLSLFGSGMIALGATALLLSLAGIFAMTALAVRRRTREIGIRVALGASPGEILAVVSRRALLHLGIGSGLGMVLGTLVLMLVETQESGIVTTSPWLLGGTALLLGAVAMLACGIPARRALRIDPARALGQD